MLVHLFRLLFAFGPISPVIILIQRVDQLVNAKCRVRLTKTTVNGSELRVSGLFYSRDS